jgi:hypothetical protein
MTGMDVFIHDTIAYLPQILAGLKNTALLTGIISVTVSSAGSRSST